MEYTHLDSDLVSVIIPCYNQGQFLEEAIESILLQTHKNWECIIVNDGSTDNSLQLAQNLALKNAKIKVIDQHNKGLAGARNSGIAYCSGQYILPLDADDKIGSTYLAQALKVLKEQPEVGIVYCNAELWGEKSGKWVLHTPIPEIMSLNNQIFCSAIFRKKDFFDAAKQYDETLKMGLEDWDVWLYFIEKQFKIIKLKDTLFYYRIRNNSMLRNEDLIKQAWLKVFIKHYDYFNSIKPSIIESIEERSYYRKNFEKIKQNWIVKILIKLRLIRLALHNETI